ncbi:MAG TPA: GTPase [Candidatus Lokiarchaeia archaeon]|nr:GTPase [Candidatus Lokiarchaeia archaeon]
MRTPKAWADILHVIEKQADVILEILDARDPEGTRPRKVEELIAEKFPEKKLFLVLNKQDMVPEDVVNAWSAYYQAQGFICFHASAAKKEGTNFLLAQILRYVDHSAPSKILIVGYPNSGKSSIINAILKEKKTARVSPEAGFTRGIQWLKIEGFAHLYLLDSPGVVPYDEEESELELALKAAIKTSKIQDPETTFEEIYRRSGPEKLKQVYDIDFTDSADFVEKLGRKRGKLLKGGIVEERAVWLIVIRDWQRNYIPFYTVPPGYSGPNMPENN